MIPWIVNRWRARQRQIDIEVLWPSCKKLARDPHQARLAFAVHAFNDPAWRALGGDDEIVRRIEELG